MAPLPTIADVYRVELDWFSVHGIRPVNVFHVKADAGTLGDIVDAIDTATSLEQYHCVHEDWSYQSVTITPLDGSTAAQTIGVSEKGGSGTGEWIPATCGLVSIATMQRGSRGRGRMYFGPCSEDAVVNGSLGAGTLGAMGTAWAAFAEALSDPDAGPVLGVASYTHSDFHQWSSIRVDSLTATQRRRQDQLR